MFPGELLGNGFISHFINGIGRRSDKDQPLLETASGKERTFGKKAIAGMNGINIIFLCGFNDVFNIKEFRDVISIFSVKSMTLSASLK